MTSGLAPRELRALLDLSARLQSVERLVGLREWHAAPARRGAVHRHHGIRTQSGLPIATTGLPVTAPLTRIGAVAKNRGAGDLAGGDCDVRGAAWRRGLAP
jgi:hypothetical protein